MINVIAGTTSYLTVDFFDENGAASSPLSISYTVTSLFNGATIRAATSVTPAISVTIVLTASQDNGNLPAGESYDSRRVTVTAGFSGGASSVSYFDYNVTSPTLS
jgi:hypothetical protein